MKANKLFLCFSFITTVITNTANATDLLTQNQAFSPITAIFLAPTSSQQSFPIVSSKTREYQEYYRYFQKHFLRMRENFPVSKRICEEALASKDYRASEIYMTKLNILIQKTQDKLAAQQTIAKKFVDEVDTLKLTETIPLIDKISTTLKTLKTIKQERETQETKINIEDLYDIYGIEDVYYNYITQKMKHLSSLRKESGGSSCEKIRKIAQDTDKTKAEIEPIYQQCILLEKQVKELEKKLLQ